MKVGVVLLTVGVIALCLGLAIHGFYGVSENEFLSPYVWHLLCSGAFFAIVGLLFLLPTHSDD